MTRFSSSQIVKILNEFEGGKSIGEVCRSYRISQGTLYNWRKKYGGMEATDPKKLKRLEDENHNLKRMYAELALDHQMAKHRLSRLYMSK